MAAFHSSAVTEVDSRPGVGVARRTLQRGLRSFRASL